MREVLIDKQGNFGSLAGLPPAAMRYTEARLSGAAAEMMRDIDRETVDFTPTYDNDRLEPVVLPARFPNLLVNGSNGIAVGMATSIPPHNMAEVCEAVIRVIDDPDLSLDELLDVMPGPDFPTGGIICGTMGIRQAFMTGRSTLTLRSRTHFETENNADVIVVTEIPYQETRDRIREKLEVLVRDERIKGISRIVDLTDRNDSVVAGAAAYRAQTRRRQGCRAESAVPVFSAANHRQRDHAGSGRQSTAADDRSDDAGCVHSPSRRRDPSPHRIHAA